MNSWGQKHGSCPHETYIWYSLCLGEMTGLFFDLCILNI